MATLALNRIVRHLHDVALTGDDAGLSDGELLTGFLTHGDEGAFAALVKRYGPMVLGVCQRVLHNRHDAEDAFQAAFLVLVRKGNGIVPRDMVGNWLHGVAFRTALHAKRSAAKRREKERKMSRAEAVRPDAEPGLDEILDQELDKLPDKYRAPLVLCDLQGKTRKEAAQHLSCPEGTVAGRLVRARQLLARRLTQRGLAVSAAALGLLLSQKTASAAVSATLVASTIEAGALYAAGSVLAGSAISANVAALTEGVLKTMVIMKLKKLALIVVACFLTAGLGLVGQSLFIVEGPAAIAAPPDGSGSAPKDEKKDAPPKKDEAKPEQKPDAASTFTKIHLKQGKAVIRQTGKESVEIKGNDIFTQNAKKEIKDGTLRLEGFNVEFIVEVKDLTALTIDGLSSADVKQLKGKTLEVTVGGNGNVTLAGAVDEQTFKVTAIGKCNAEGCKGKQAKVHVDGNGLVAVNVTDKLQANIQGIGRVYYLGKPATETEVGFNGQLLPGPAPANVGGGPFGGLGDPATGFGRHQPFAAANRLGVALSKPSDVLIEQLDLPKDQGLVVSNVKADSAAGKAGLKNHDILLEFGGKKVSSQLAEFHKALNEFKTGAKVEAIVLRKGKRETVKDVTLPDAPKGFGPQFPGGGFVPPFQPPFQPGGFPPNPPVQEREKPIPPKDEPAKPGSVKITAKVDGYTQGTEFNTQKYPFKYTGVSRLDADQLKALAKPGNIADAAAKALLGAALWPGKDDKFDKIMLKSDGKKITGDVELSHKYGAQGVHVLKFKIEGSVDETTLMLRAVDPVILGTWDWGGGKIKLVGKVDLQFEIGK